MTFPSSRKLIVASYALAFLAIFLAMGFPGSIEEWVNIAAFLIWAIFPVFSLCLINQKSRIFSSAAAVMGISGIAIYVDAVYGEDVSSTSGLIFFFLPVWQLLAVLVFTAVFYGLRVLRMKSRDR